METAVRQTQSKSLDDILAEIKALDLTGETCTVEIDPAAAANQSLVDPLTNRELEVLQLIAEGLSNQQIADHLIISKGTVKYYTSNIYSKLQVSNRTQAVAQAREIRIL